VLVGGGAKLYSLVNYLREIFGPEKVLLSDNPDELVSMGAGYQFGRDFDDIPPSIVFSVEEITGESAAQSEPDAYALQEVNGQKHKLRNSKNMLGRAVSNDIAINDQKSSRFHAEINVQSSEVFLVDLASTNGTFIDGKRLTPGEAYFISPQNRIQIGDTEFFLISEE
jgi:pSer/pThr/pTyr-binding forkhead associated (FHA) protein